MNHLMYNCKMYYELIVLKSWNLRTAKPFRDDILNFDLNKLVRPEDMNIVIERLRQLNLKLKYCF